MVHNAATGTEMSSPHPETLHAQARSVSSNGIVMNLVEAGAGSPLVFLHGLGWDHQLWLPALDRYAGRYHTITGDSRGHGQTDKPAGPYTMTQFADDWAGALEEVAGEAAYLVGLSQGGMIAQDLAIRTPHLVKSLVLVSTTCKEDPETVANMSERLANMRQAGARAAAEVAAKSIFSDAFRDANPDYLEDFVTARAAQPQEPLISAMAALKDFDYRDGLKNLDIPTLVIAGTEDALTPPAAVREVAAHIAGAELVEIEGAGHIIPVEQPETFYRTIDQFLSRRVAATH